jgi:aspartyl-tRNA(Asn)/glutamyl-tRNA(Gln) amidotransferase subunit B
LGIGDSCISPDALGQLVARIADNTISGKMAKDVFLAVWNSDLSPDQVIASRGLRQLSDSSALETFVKEVLADNPEQVEQYRSGKQKILGYLVGQVMKKTQGRASPKLVNSIIRDLITPP